MFKSLLDYQFLQYISRFLRPTMWQGTFILLDSISTPTPTQAEELFHKEEDVLIKLHFLTTEKEIVSSFLSFGEEAQL